MARSNDVIVGIDPGTRSVGWGAVVVGGSLARAVGAGVLRPNPKLSIPERLCEIRTALDLLFAEFRPTVVVVEEAFSAQNVQSALRIGEGRGVVLASAVGAGALVVQYPPAVAKKAICGHGGAHKTRVAAMVARLLGLARPPEPLDATDALALALTHVLKSSGPVAGSRRSKITERDLAIKAPRG